MTWHFESVLNWIWPCCILIHITFQVSQGSAATDLRWGKNFNKFLLRNSLLYIAVKKLRKSVNICLSYWKNKSVSFFYGPRCSFGNPVWCMLVCATNAMDTHARTDIKQTQIIHIIILENCNTSISYVIKVNIRNTIGIPPRIAVLLLNSDFLLDIIYHNMIHSSYHRHRTISSAAVADKNCTTMTLSIMWTFHWQKQFVNVLSLIANHDTNGSVLWSKLSIQWLSTGYDTPFGSIKTNKWKRNSLICLQNTAEMASMVSQEHQQIELTNRPLWVLVSFSALHFWQSDLKGMQQVANLFHQSSNFSFIHVV